MKFNPLLLFTIFFISCNNDFELKAPNKVLLQDTSEEIIYKYLENNYSPITEKTDLQKVNGIACAFTQGFENQIKYTVNNCEEAGGINVDLEFPKIKEEKIKLWIEQIYEADLTDLPNQWNKEGTLYGPVDQEAGCYYTLEEKPKNWLVTIYCGC